MSSPPEEQVGLITDGDKLMEEDTANIIPSARYTRMSSVNRRQCNRVNVMEVSNELLSRFTSKAGIVELWRKKMEDGVLSTSHFQDHWRVTVPRIYSPQPNRTCLDWSFDEDLASKLLLKPLEQFVWGWGSCGEQPPPRRSTLCGRVFKHGEPAYSCRECGMDNTCVLCVECFKVSAHRHHKYKMGQSGGGGCCDCGDTEAWKRDPFCELHAACKDEEQAESTVSPDVIERMKIVASVCLSYCFRLLTLDHAPGLPNDLRLKDADRDLLQILDQPDCYCTVLYNDESHTFEQVITTLTRVMKCNHRDSVELVSLIDREGRALMKCNSFQVCDKLKTDIESRTAMFERFTSRQGHTLKVLVMHVHVIAHQTFAMKLLNWLQNFVSQEPSLRLAVSQTALGTEGSGGPGSSTGPGGVAVGVMQNDCRMWKAARTAWHRLLIATTLMDYATKREMAILFTKNYGSILKDFIRDDHDHSFSISSLSVQMYTTPTLAHLLIARHDALFVVMNTFVSECVRRCNAEGRLEFERNNVSLAFRRAQFILYDVKYLLSSVPTTFDDELRKRFLHGLSLILKLLVMMQGMDSVLRQVGQHMEFEPEWEPAFNLHVKLAHSITLSLEWCSADRALLASAYRLALKRYADNDTMPALELRELGNQSALVIPYDVSSKPVSIHRPLSRFIAGLHLQLHKHGLSYGSQDLARDNMPTPVHLIEPVLQTMAMIAQVHAGMWRRNGFALLNQLYFYHNVKCRAEMLDRDIVMLQIGASLIESNEFVIHVLNKFNLLDWAAADFEQRPLEDDTLRHTISMVEEFLGLMITIVGSRYVPGVGEVTNEDRTKKEIIQMLCVKPMPHSELNRCLPEDQVHETGLEAVIHEVADFVKPSEGNRRGVYKLKPHLYDEYDTFFYHYTREELSRSEEEQRNRRKAAGLQECCPPPPLPRLAPPFRLLASLLQSDAALHVLGRVLSRAADLRARCYSECAVHKALHLIGYALRDEESGHYEFVAFAEKAARAGLLALLQKLCHSRRLEAHQPLAKHLYDKMRAILGQTDEHIGDGESMKTDQDNQPSSEEAANAEKTRRAKLAAQRRAKVMAQMKAQMNNFITNNSTLFEETTTEVTAEEQDIRPLYVGAALGVAGGGAVDPPRVCIMCQEEARVDITSEPLVLVAFVQPSTVLCPAAAATADTVAVAAHGASGHVATGAGPQPHVSSCGHVLHAHCTHKYLTSLFDKENRRPYRLRQVSAFDVEKREYLCPLCERLCNCALPLLPSAPAAPAPPALSAAAYRRAVRAIVQRSHLVRARSVVACSEVCEELHCRATPAAVAAGASAAPSHSEDTEPSEEAEVFVSTHAENVLPPDFLQHLQSDIPNYPDSLKSLVEEFVAGLPGMCNLPEYRGLGTIGTLYRATSYTILSTNVVLQAEHRPLLGDLPSRHRDTLQTLIRLAAAIPAIWSSPNHLAHHALTSLNTLEYSSPLTYQPFSLLVPLVLSAPSIFCKNNGPARPTHLARQITIQVLQAALTRAMIVADISSCTSEPMDMEDVKPPKQDLENLLDLVKLVRRGNLDTDNLNAEEVWEQIKSQCHNFLRCCCIFYHFLSDINPPTELTVVNGDTWEVMCGYLDLPSTFKDLFEEDEVREKAVEWSSLSSEWFAGAIDPKLVVDSRDPPRLIPLPDDFSELMNVVSEFSCPNSEREDSKYPTMCLVCGQILCSQSYCCQTEIPKAGRGGAALHVGAGMAHARRCGAGAGLLLRVRDCELLLLHAPARGALLPAPYLDTYGETDQGLRRGNPLRLCVERYEEARMLWLGHAVRERIARSIDTTMLVSTQWQNM